MTNGGWGGFVDRSLVIGAGLGAEGGNALSQVGGDGGVGLGGADDFKCGGHGGGIEAGCMKQFGADAIGVFLEGETIALDGAGDGGGIDEVAELVGDDGGELEVSAFFEEAAGEVDLSIGPGVGGDVGGVKDEDADVGPLGVGVEEALARGASALGGGTFERAAVAVVEGVDRLARGGGAANGAEEKKEEEGGDSHGEG